MFANFHIEGVFYTLILTPVYFGLESNLQMRLFLSITQALADLTKIISKVTLLFLWCHMNYKNPTNTECFAKISK